jgi:hypothetical protein
MAIGAASAHADAVTEWNAKAADIIAAGRLTAPPANRVLAIAHVSVFEAVNAITGRYPPSGRVVLEVAPGASVDAAVAAAMRSALGKLLPPQQADIDGWGCTQRRHRRRREGCCGDPRTVRRRWRHRP